jgi:hypothetical protein
MNNLESGDVDFLAGFLDPEIYDEFCLINHGLSDAQFFDKLKKLVNESTVIRYKNKENL